MKSEEETPYDLNLHKYTHHKKVFPWMFIIKALVAFGLIYFAYYMTQEISNQKFESPQLHEIEAPAIETENN
jgi:heme/copper-type cytochrome/quinol oxidase subunit 3